MAAMLKDSNTWPCRPRAGGTHQRQGEARRDKRDDSKLARAPARESPPMEGIFWQLGVQGRTEHKRARTEHKRAASAASLHSQHLPGWRRRHHTWSPPRRRRRGTGGPAPGRRLGAPAGRGAAGWEGGWLAACRVAAAKCAGRPDPSHSCAFSMGRKPALLPPALHAAGPGPQHPPATTRTTTIAHTNHRQHPPARPRCPARQRSWPLAGTCAWSRPCPARGGLRGAERF